MSRDAKSPASSALRGRGGKPGYLLSGEAFVWYRGSVTIPANTPASGYASADVEVCPGVITMFYRLFPPGCAGRVHLQVFYQTRQIFPTTPGQSYIGDGSEILGDASVALDEPEYVLQLRAWSPTTTYQHIVYCEFYVQREVPMFPGRSTVERLPLPDLGV